MIDIWGLANLLVLEWIGKWILRGNESLLCVSGDDFMF